MFKNRRQFVTGLLTALLALAGLVGASSQALHAGAPKEPRLEGTLTGVNVAASSVAVRLQNGTVRSIIIPATAKVERNGIKVRLSAFKIGDRVQARFTLDGSTVTKFEGVGP